MHRFGSIRNRMLSRGPDASGVWMIGLHRMGPSRKAGLSLSALGLPGQGELDSPPSDLEGRRQLQAWLSPTGPPLAQVVQPPACTVICVHP